MAKKPSLYGSEKKCSEKFSIINYYYVVWTKVGHLERKAVNPDSDSYFVLDPDPLLLIKILRF
jgi:hypothetical protein